VLLAVLLLLAAGCYALWDSEQVYRDAESAQYSVYKPVKDELSFGELRVINPEVFAWLSVYGTHIDYPVVQGPDDMKYVNTNAKGNYSLSGAIFLDSDSARDFSDFSSILYGHHMDKNAMFGEIGRFSDRKFFDERKYGSLYYDGREHGLEFFAFLHVDAYDGRVFRTGITGRDAKETYLGTLLKNAMHTRDIGGIDPAKDRIVLLSTCSASSTNGRDILVGRITDELYEDTFAASGDNSVIRLTADGLASLWGLIPLWARPLIPAFIFIAAGTLGLIMDSRRKRAARQ
jgi:sortase B